MNPMSEKSVFEVVSPVYLWTTMNPIGEELLLFAPAAADCHCFCAVLRARTRRTL
jgi:hypothetical protein